MNKYSFLSAILIVICCVLTACSKLSDNGPIDGKWRLEKMYSKSSAASTSYTDEKYLMDENIYWSFQLNLLSITSSELLNGYTGETTARFNLSGDQLNITQTYIHFRDRDSLLTDPTTMQLQALGIRGNACNYHIRTLSSSRMVLCSDADSLVFYKLH